MLLPEWPSSPSRRPAFKMLFTAEKFCIFPNLTWTELRSVCLFTQHVWESHTHRCTDSHRFWLLSSISLCEHPTDCLSGPLPGAIWVISNIRLLWIQPRRPSSFVLSRLVLAPPDSLHFHGVSKVLPNFIQPCGDYDQKCFGILDEFIESSHINGIYFPIHEHCLSLHSFWSSLISLRDIL